MREALLEARKHLASLGWSVTGGTNLRDLIDAALAVDPPPSGASPQAETSEDMGDGWYVTVGRWGESLVTIEQRCLSGNADLTDDDAALIRGAAKHLQAFIGHPAPVSPVEPTPEPETCEWRYSADAEWWQSGCDSQDLSGDERLVGPDEKAKFCPYCGKPLRLVEDTPR